MNEYVIKAQILAGGRGKGVFSNGYKGGVKLTKKLVSYSLKNITMVEIIETPLLIILVNCSNKLLIIFFSAAEIADIAEQMLGHRLTTKQTGKDGVLVSKVSFFAF